MNVYVDVRVKLLANSSTDDHIIALKIAFELKFSIFWLCMRFIKDKTIGKPNVYLVIDAYLVISSNCCCCRTIGARTISLRARKLIFRQPSLSRTYCKECLLQILLTKTVL